MLINKIQIWLRAIRIKFLFSSIISVAMGLIINYHNNNFVDLYQAILTICGVVSLHISVDLLNDYWDFKRGIDLKTHRTKFSGGTGILPSGLIKPSHVYLAGLFFLSIGISIGVYFIYSHGIIIAIILIFAIFSIYFYSTKVVDHGLSEIFVCVKGAMILLGSYFIQSYEIDMDVIVIGINIGILSSFILFVSSFPDFDADKSCGRKTIIIIFGKKKSTMIYWIFPILLYVIVIVSVLSSLITYYCLLAFLVFPLTIKSGILLQKNYNDINTLESAISYIVLFSKLYGLLLILGFIIEMTTTS